MTRRDLTARWASGVMVWTGVLSCLLLTSSASGQSDTRSKAATQPRKEAAVPTTPATPATPVGRPAVGKPQPPVEPPLPPEMQQMLHDWEVQSIKITKLHGAFTRYKYDSVFETEKRSEGLFWYQNPDRGRMDFNAMKIDPAQASRKLTLAKKPYSIVSDKPERWICTGKEILVIDDKSKSFSQVTIPPQHQGENIVNGPLPFLFGMKAEQAKTRYFLSFGEKHNPNTVIHLVAGPKLKVDAQEWSRAEVMLNPTTFLPKGIKLFDPAGTTETVYVFDKIEVNKPNGGFFEKVKEPFSANLKGYDKQVEEKGPSQPNPQEFKNGDSLVPRSGKREADPLLPANTASPNMKKSGPAR